MDQAGSPLSKPENNELVVPSKYALPRHPDNISLIPIEHNYDQNYIIYRIKLAPVEIDLQTRDALLQTMNKGRNNVVIDDMVLFPTSFSSIEPLPIKKKPKQGHIEGNVWIQDEP